MILLPIILITALILRLISLGQSFWLDEAVQTWASSKFSPHDLLWQYLPGDFNPPLYHLILHYWIDVFGTSEMAVRMLSVILGLGSIVLIYQLVRVISQKNRVAKLAAIFIATAPLHLYYSQEARMYILACLTTLLAIYSFFLFISKKSWSRAIFFGFSLVAMTGSHFVTLFNLPVFFFIALWETKKRTLKSREEKIIFLFPWLILATVAFFYYPLFRLQLNMGQNWTAIYPVWSQTVGSFSLKSLALLPVKFIIGRISFSPPWWYALISITAIIIFFRFFFQTVKRSLSFNLKSGIKILQKNIFYLSLFFLVPTTLTLAVSVNLPIFSYFRLLFILPIFYILIAFAVSQKPTWFKIILGLNLIFCCIYLGNSRFHRENWKDAAIWLKGQNRIYGSPTIVLSQIDKPLDYYSQESFPIISVGSADDLDLPESYQFISLVSYGLPIFDPEDKIRGKLAETGYRIDAGESFRGVGVERWTRR